MYTYHAKLMYLPAVIVWTAIALFLIFKKKVDIKQVTLYSLFYIYIMLVFGVTLFPIQNYPLEYPPEQNFIPTNTIKMLIVHLPTTIAIKQILGNIVMFMPFGYLLPFFKKNKPFVNCVVFALAFSVFIELLQFVLGATFVGSQYRSVDIDDVILNFIGAIIGYIIFIITPKFIKQPYLELSNED